MALRLRHGGLLYPKRVLVYILSLNVVKRVYIQHLSMSNFKSNLMDNFFSPRRCGGALPQRLPPRQELNDLNRCARLVPDDVKGMASILSNTQAGDPDVVQDLPARPTTFHDVDDAELEESFFIIVDSTKQ